MLMYRHQLDCVGKAGVAWLMPGPKKTPVQPWAEPLLACDMACGDGSLNLMARSSLEIITVMLVMSVLQEFVVVVVVSNKHNMYLKNCKIMILFSFYDTVVQCLLL